MDKTFCERNSLVTGNVPAIGRLKHGWSQQYPVNQNGPTTLTTPDDRAHDFNLVPFVHRLELRHLFSTNSFHKKTYHDQQPFHTSKNTTNANHLESGQTINQHG
jgi:hypothetical protein